MQETTPFRNNEQWICKLKGVCEAFAQNWSYLIREISLHTTTHAVVQEYSCRNNVQHFINIWHFNPLKMC